MQHVYGRGRRQYRKIPSAGGGVLRLLLCGFLFTAAIVGRQVLPEGYREALMRGLDSGISCRELIEAVGASAGSREARQMLWEKGVLEVFGLHREEAVDAAKESEDAEAPAAAFLGKDLLEYPVIPVIQMEEHGVETETVSAPEQKPETEETADAQEAEQAPEVPETEPEPIVSRTDENGRVLPDIVSMESVKLSIPTVTPVYGVLTSDFGYRDHPIDGEFKFHYGVDLAAPTGTEVGSFSDGTVSFAGWGEINGYYIRVEHADGIETLYAHLSEILVSVGDRVDAGECIGLVGETGETSGPHLHFQVYVDGILVDPLQYVEYMV